MTTTAWVDSYLALTANNILVSTDDKGDAVPPEEIKNVFASIKEMSMKSTSTSYAVVLGPDGRMWLKHQALPRTAEALTSKPGKCFASVIVMLRNFSNNNGHCHVNGMVIASFPLSQLPPTPFILILPYLLNLL
jgi:hypothetical protein